MIRRTGTCFGYSSIAQWQSIRLLIEGLLVRVQLEEPNRQVRDFFPGLLFRALTRIQEKCGNKPGMGAVARMGDAVPPGERRCVNVRCPTGPSQFVWHSAGDVVCRGESGEWGRWQMAMVG